MYEDFWIPTKDHINVYTKKWFTPNQQPRAIIQLSHGMVEHINRYNHFAEFLVENNFIVYGHDQRGHGETGREQGKFGYFAKEKGFQKITEDLYEITKKIRKMYPAIPIFLFGHSMGSFLVRNYLQYYSDAVDGVILSGTGFYPIATTQTVKAITKLLPPEDEIIILNKLAFGSYNRKIKDKKTNFDWLTRDDKIVEAYMNDPNTAFLPTGRFFYDLMTGLSKIHTNKLNKSIRTDIPMLFVSGDADPVGDYGKGVWKTAYLYNNLGIKQITTMLFENGRHEMINEINREEVFHAIKYWLERQLKTKQRGHSD